MEREDLINEIIYFCFAYRLLNKKIDINELKKGLERLLDDVDFVESLIHMFSTKPKKRKNMNIEKLKEILIELEKIRLDLEYKK